MLRNAIKPIAVATGVRRNSRRRNNRMGSRSFNERASFLRTG